MPIDELAGETVDAALELVGDAVLGDDPPKKRSRLRRFLGWSFLALIGGVLVGVVYLALS